MMQEFLSVQVLQERGHVYTAKIPRAVLNLLHFKDVAYCGYIDRDRGNDLIFYSPEPFHEAKKIKIQKGITAGLNIPSNVRKNMFIEAGTYKMAVENGDLFLEKA